MNLYPNHIERDIAKIWKIIIPDIYKDNKICFLLHMENIKFNLFLNCKNGTSLFILFFKIYLFL